MPSQSKIQNPDSKIRWGLVGCGWVARDYVAPGIAAAPNSHLAAACDTDAEAAARVRPKDESVERFTDLDAMLAAGDLDAVYVATPNDSHPALTERVAAAGLPVFCEKPMARTAAEAARMVEACEQAGVAYATAFDQRFHAAHERLRDLIAEGALGTVTCVRTHYACWTPPDWTPDPDVPHDNWRADPDRAGGGAFMDLAPHGLDLTQMLLGERLVTATALLQRRVHDYAVDDGAVLIGQTEHGALLSQTVAYNCPDAFPRRRLEVLGTEGRALALDTMGQDAGGTLTLMDAEGRERDIDFSADDRSPFARQIEVFAACLLDGRPFPFPPERDLHTMRLLEEAVREMVGG